MSCGKCTLSNSLDKSCLRPSSVQAHPHATGALRRASNNTGVGSSLPVGRKWCPRRQSARPSVLGTEESAAKMMMCASDRTPCFVSLRPKSRASRWLGCLPTREAGGRGEDSGFHHLTLATDAETLLIAWADRTAALLGPWSRGRPSSFASDAEGGAPQVLVAQSRRNDCRAETPIPPSPQAASFSVYLRLAFAGVRTAVRGDMAAAVRRTPVSSTSSVAHRIRHTSGRSS